MSVALLVTCKWVIFPFAVCFSAWMSAGLCRNDNIRYTLQRRGTRGQGTTHRNIGADSIHPWWHTTCTSACVCCLRVHLEFYWVSDLFLYVLNGFYKPEYCLILRINANVPGLVTYTFGMSLSCSFGELSPTVSAVAVATCGHETSEGTSAFVCLFGLWIWTSFLQWLHF